MIFYSRDHVLPGRDDGRFERASTTRAASVRTVSAQDEAVKLHHRLLLLIICAIALVWLAACVILTLSDGRSAMFTFPGAGMAGLIAYATFRGAIGRPWKPGVDTSNVDG